VSKVALAFRPAREDDLERLLDIHVAAYPDGRAREVRRRNFVHNALGRLEDLLVAIEGGTIVGHGFLFALQGWFGGARVRLGGIASVGVAPEARGRGVGTQLVLRLQEAARVSGCAAVVLYGFRQGFYARLGYRPTTPHLRLRLHPAAIPFRPELRLRVADGNDLARMRLCWDAQAGTRTGSLARSAGVWEARLAEERRTWIVADGPQGVDGYVAWTLDQAEPRPGVTLTVVDMAARTKRAWWSLWGAIAAQRDQVSSVYAEVPADDPLAHALVDPDRACHGGSNAEHVVGELARGPLVRILDPATALTARGYAAEGTTVLSVEGECLELSIESGCARATPTTAEPAIRTTLPALSAVALGAVPLRQAARLGWLQAKDERSLAFADALLALPPYFSPDPF
jgi:predicted acetyltransferase